MSNEANNPDLTERLLLTESSAILKASQQLEQLERDLIALLYTVWRVSGKSKKVVTIKDRSAE